jgi:MFS family permease
MPGKPITRVYTKHFWLLCVSSLLFFASFNMIIPVLPGYLTELGGAQWKGLIISLFTVTALLSRPFSGKLADKIGRLPVIFFGALVCIICSFIYPWLNTVSAMLWLRLFHGFSTGFTPTGQTAYLADIIPLQKRGEGMGILGTANSVGMAGGLALGGWLEYLTNINVVFYASSGLALLSALVLLGIRETLHDKQSFSIYHFKLHKSDLFEPRVLAPCVVMLLAGYSYGAVVTLLPDYSLNVGMTNKGMLLTYFTLASLAVRLIGGKASDRFGRKPVLWVSLLFIGMAMAVLAVSQSAGAAIAAIVLYGLAHGSTSPTLLAWATDLSDPKRKGRGVSSLYIFMEFGIGLGAFISGLIFADRPENFFSSFLICVILSLLAVIYLFTETSSRKVVAGQ